MSITGNSIKALQYIFSIQYPVNFQKNPNQVQAFINFKSEVNTMTSINAKKLGFAIRKVNNSVQNIDEIILVFYNMAITGFLLQDKYVKDCFFEKMFLLANKTMDVILRVLFFTLSNANVRFPNKELE